jgi:ATP-dependent Lon protease
MIETSILSPRDSESSEPAISGSVTPTTTKGADLPTMPPDVIPILPLRDTILFPHALAPLSIGREGSVRAAQYSALNKLPLGILLQRDSSAEEPGASDLYEIGTLTRVLRYVTSADNQHHIICRGETRFRIIEFVTGYPFLAARIEKIDDNSPAGPGIDARVLRLRERIKEALQYMREIPGEVMTMLDGIAAPGALADVVANFAEIKIEEKQKLLETFDVRARLDRVLWFLSYQIEVLRLSQDIDKQTRQTLEGRQREHMLREQMRTIQKELGEGETKDTGLAEAIAKAGMPADVEAHAKKELGRLERLGEGAPEQAMLRTYLEWLTELPWNVTTAGIIDIPAARKQLDEDHYGLEKAKRRILEYLAVRKLNPAGKSPILCLVGPPGVGKTSLGQSIARAMGRKFVRLSLGGVHDEAEIRGHRRTYIGAMPGNIIQALRRAGSRDCVLMLDEIDKLGRSIHGDPSSALLEVLDPAQNGTFRDNYLGVTFDLSQVVFIATANSLETVPVPLLDRMEVISVAGYTRQEKLQIATRYLLPRQREMNGVNAEQCEVTQDAINAVIAKYTREAGVRSLERELGALLRHCAVRLVEDSSAHVRIGANDIPTIFGPVRFEAEAAQRTSVPGVATGLAWTPVGGDILFIEATKVPGRGKLILTGQLGDVMKESAQAALSLVKSSHLSLGFEADVFEASDVHVHVPAGAVPKDGPSAGVAMFMALASLFTGRTVRADTAMTGEISLRGLVLPVGGIKEKTLAAHQAGIKRVMIPARNRKDWEEIPEDVRTDLEFIWLETVEQAMAAGLDARSSTKPT